MKSVIYNKVLTNILLVITLLFSIQAFAKPPVYTSFFSSVAVSGYDTVAYFTESKAIKGNAQYSTEHKGVEWHFSSQANLKLFKNTPEKYTPQYGGYCAWAVAHNDTAKSDPQQWTIHNNKLYLNYNSEIQGQWLQNKTMLITNADRYWPTLIK